MSRVIYKYPLQVRAEQKIEMRRFRQLLCVQLQAGVPTLWAVVNTETQLDTVTIRCYGTGPNTGSPDTSDLYLGTVQLDGFVWHYFSPRRESYRRVSELD